MCAVYIETTRADVQHAWVRILVEGMDIVIMKHGSNVCGCFC